MNHEEFLKAIQKGQIANCYLFSGVEEYIKLSMLHQIRKILFPTGLDELNETVLNNPDISTLTAACETMPFGAEKRLVIVKESKLFLPSAKEEEDSQGSEFFSYLEHLPQTVCLIFYAKGKVDARKKIVAYCKKNAEIVDFSPLSDEKCIEWIQKSLRSQEKQISYQNACYLIFTVGNSVSLLHQEMSKLCSYVDEKQSEITERDIDAICIPSTECTVFQMVDDQVAGKLDSAFALLGKLFKNGEDGMMVLAMLLRQYRILYHMRCLLDEKTTNQNMASLLGIPPFTVERIKRQALRYSKERLKQAYEYLMEYEYHIKQGRVSMEACAETALLKLQYLLNPV